MTVVLAMLSTTLTATMGSAAPKTGDVIDLGAGESTTIIKPAAGAPSSSGPRIGSAPEVTGDATVDTQATRPRGTATVSARGRFGSYEARYGAKFDTKAGGDPGVVGHLRVQVEDVAFAGKLAWDGQLLPAQGGPPAADPRGGCAGCLTGHAGVVVVVSAVDLDTGALLATKLVERKSAAFTGGAPRSVQVDGRKDITLPDFDVGAAAHVAVFVTLTVNADSHLRPDLTRGAATAEFSGPAPGKGAKPKERPPGVSYKRVQVRVTGTATTTTQSRCAGPSATPQGEGEATLLRYYQAIDAGDYLTAFGVLAPALRTGWASAGPTSTGDTNFAAFMAEHIECVRVTDITVVDAPGDPEVSASLGIQWYRVTFDARYKTPLPAGSGELQPFYKVHADPHTGPNRPPSEITAIATSLPTETSTTTAPTTTTSSTTTSTTTSSTTTSTTSTTSTTTTPPTTRVLTGPTAVVSLGDSFISGEAGRWEGNVLNPLLDRGGTDRAFAFQTETHVQEVTDEIQSWGIFGWFTDFVTRLVTTVVQVPTWDAARVYGATAANGCHRSDTAEVNAQIPGIDAHINLACSGGVAANVYRRGHGGESFKGESPQASQLVEVAKTHQVRLIVMSIGGNDLQFGDIVADCVFAYTLSPAQAPDHCQDGWSDHVTAELDRTATTDNTVNKVRKAVDEVRAAMETPVSDGGAGYAPSQYRIVMQSYPSPIPRGSEFAYDESLALPFDIPSSVLGLAGVTASNGRIALGCPFWDSDATWARDTVVPAISNALGAIATEKGVAFLDLRDFLQNREVCSVHTNIDVVYGPPSGSSSEWARAVFTGAAQGDKQESIHPNAYAQRGLQRCLTSAYDHIWNQQQPTVHLRCINQTGGPENVTTQVITP